MQESIIDCMLKLKRNCRFKEFLDLVSINKLLTKENIRFSIRYFCIVLAVFLLVLPLLACQGDEPEARVRDAG